MQAFTSEEMRQQVSQLQKLAAKEPVFITDDGRLRWVLMSMEEFDRLHGRRRDRASIVELPDAIADQIESLAPREDESAA